MYRNHLKKSITNITSELPYCNFQFHLMSAAELVETLNKYYIYPLEKPLLSPLSMPNEVCSPISTHTRTSATQALFAHKSC